MAERQGIGTTVVLDDKTCPLELVPNLSHLLAQESCGWCTPCWSGLAWCEQILDATEDGDGEPGDLEALELQSHFNALGHTFCALAPGAAEPLQRALERLREESQQHLELERGP